MKSPALKIALIYFLFGIVWIILSDTYFNEISIERSNFLLAQSIKGLAYVFLSSLVLYVIILRNTKKELAAKAEYERLFRENPNPMWIYDKDTLKILAVNESAISRYGYSSDDFLSLKITDLQAEVEDEEILAEEIHNNFRNGPLKRHKTSKGDTYYCEIHGHSTIYHDRPAHLILALDVNDKILAEKRILEQNEQLRQIAQMQAHDIRGPLASILGLVSILDKGGTDIKGNTKILENLEKACLALDHKIREIVKTSSGTNY